MNFKNCPYCGKNRLYKVSKTSLKCAYCSKKFSTVKLQRDYDVLKYFIDEFSAKKCSEELNLNYKSVKERFDDFRKIILLHVEEIYKTNHKEFIEYDEYYFLPKNKRGKVKYLFESIGILGQVYSDNKVYTVLLPDQFAHLRGENFNKEINLAYIKEYSKYLNRYKIVHFKEFDSLIIKFWAYLEMRLDKYKGILRENFIYYLKESEFKFNYTKEEQFKTIWSLWLRL
jgi:transposase-like protein/DNA-directed RNA polymerase subunit RPC12/RpoP